MINKIGFVLVLVAVPASLMARGPGVPVPDSAASALLLTVGVLSVLAYRRFHGIRK